MRLRTAYSLKRLSFSLVDNAKSGMTKAAAAFSILVAVLQAGSPMSIAGALKVMMMKNTALVLK